jgi:hypothetical protein
MAEKPADAGASAVVAGDLALPPAVHHHDYPRPVPGYRPDPAAAAPRVRPEASHLRPEGPPRRPEAPPRRPEAPPRRPEAPPRRQEARGHRHRTTSTTSRARTHAAARPEATEPPSMLSWLAYLLVLAGIVTGLLVALHASRDALAGTAVTGGTLLAAALARLVLPPRYAGPLCSRSRTYDVLALTALGGSVLAIVLTLP